MPDQSATRTVTNPATNDSRVVTLQQYREQGLHQQGYTKAKKSDGSEVQLAGTDDDNFVWGT